MLLTQVKEENKRETRKVYKLNENENMTYENLWETAKSILTEKFYSTKRLRQKKNPLKSMNYSSTLRQRKDGVRMGVKNEG